MITSEVYPFLSVAFKVRGTEGEALAYVDTGFDGGLILPERCLTELGEPDNVSVVELGNGTQIAVPEYLGTVTIGERTFEVSVLCVGDEHILGREIVDGVKICFVRGRRIEVEW